MRQLLKAKILIPLFALLFLAASGTSGADKNIRLLLSVDKADYSKIEQLVNKLGGSVIRKHTLVDVMAVSVPVEKVSELSQRPEIKSTEKDVKLNVPKVREIKREGFGTIPSQVSQEILKTAPLDVNELMKSNPAIKDNYYYTNALTNTFAFYNATGHYGEGVVIGIIDAGVSSASYALAGRVVGGDNFTGDGIPATSPLNDSHGTWVACCAGADIVVIFSNPIVAETIEKYAPGSIIPEIIPGYDGIPMLGQAPLADFYSLKVLDKYGYGYLSSVAAALERAIELKQQYDNGTGGFNIRVLNISLGFPTLNAGNTYADLMRQVRKAGILVVASAGNAGPSALSLGFPGDSKNIITAGATSDAAHERIISDLFWWGPNSGYLYRPLNNNLMEYYSSRGPLANGQPDPDMAAPGSFRFCENASGGAITWASGTSFSAPTIAGAAALLISAHPDATPEELRAALLRGARKNALDGNPTVFDQGYGFLDVMNAYKKLTSHVSVLPDMGLGTAHVSANIDVLPGINVINNKNYSANTGALQPGQRAEFYYEIPRNANEVTVTISNVSTQLPPSQQNQIFGDDIYVAIHSAKTTRVEDYRAGTPAFVKSGATFKLYKNDLDIGVIRVTLLGDWTNAGAISADVRIQTETKKAATPFATATITQNQTNLYKLTVPPSTDALEMDLFWAKDWSFYPTNDLDLLLYDPNGNVVMADNDSDSDYDGYSFDAPERVKIKNPMAGDWTVMVNGYTVWDKFDVFQLYARFTNTLFTKDGVTEEAADAIPAAFALAQNYPNPFNPTTSIKYDLPFDSHVSIVIYNSLGEAVRTLINETVPAGYHSIMFDGRGDNGGELASGMYIYRINAGDYSRSMKMMMVK